MSRATTPWREGASELTLASPARGGRSSAGERRPSDAMARMSEPVGAFRPTPPTRHRLLELVTRGGGIGVLPPMLSEDEARAVASSSRSYPCSAPLTKIALIPLLVRHGHQLAVRMVHLVLTLMGLRVLHPMHP
ncbi:hypothetical protein ZWY2020_010227 [Hordeum vulgare]|nr:hypothetical protein ZWY2020_010227 [Hordeum vulgare]